MPEGRPPVGPRENVGSRDRRQHPRFPVFCISHLFPTEEGPDIGFVVDISWSGCRLACGTPLRPDMALAMYVALPNQVLPLVVDRAVVRWTRDPMYGLAFVNLHSEARQRLLHVINQAELEPPDLW